MKAYRNFSFRFVFFGIVFLLSAALLPGCGGSGEPKTKGEAGPGEEQLSSAEVPQPGRAAEEHPQKIMVFVSSETPCQTAHLPGLGTRPFRISFIGPELPNTPGTTVRGGLSVSPSIAGEWRWTGSNELEFTPKTPWVEQKYQVWFHGDFLKAPFVPSKNKIRFTPRGSCIDTRSIHLPYRITVPKLPTRKTKSLPSQLMISFDRAVAPQNLIQKNLEGEVTLQPALAGAWRWISDRVLVFAPESAWEAGKDYAVTMQPKAFARDAIIPGYEYRFSTPQTDAERIRSSFSLASLGSLDLLSDPEPSKLRLRFPEAIAPSELIKKNLEKGITLNPSIEGAWSWEDERNLLFTPAEHWPLGKKYSLQFDSTVFGDEVSNKEYKSSFVTPTLGFTLRSSELYVNPKAPKEKRVIATVYASHPFDKAAFEKHLSFRLEPRSKKRFSDGTSSKNFEFKVRYNEEKRLAYLQSDLLPIPEDDAQMRIVLRKGVTSSLGVSGSGGSAQGLVYVPGKNNYFRIETLNVAQVPGKNNAIDQVLVLGASARVVPEEAAKKVSARLLPEFHPNQTKREKKKPYRWDNLAEIDAGIIEASPPVELKLLPQLEESSEQLSFSFKADAGRSVLVTIEAGAESVDGYSLAREFRQVAHIGTLPKAVSLMSQGSLLSLSGEKTISLMTRDVAEAKIEIARLLPKTMHLLVTQMGGDFQRPWFSSSLNTDDLGERFVETRSFPTENPGQANYSGINFGALLKKNGTPPRGLFHLSVYDAKAGNYSSLSDSRIVVLTDLGLLVKNNYDGTRDVFVQSLRSGRPVAGVTIQVLGRNSVPLVTKTTSSQGHVLIPDLGDFKREKQPVVFTAEKNGDFAFLPYQRRDRVLNTSRFETGGLRSQYDAPGMQAYVFSDRGIYRPGDEVHFGLVVKSDDWTQDVTGLPLEAVLRDPRGREILKKKVRLDKTGFEEISYTSQDSSPTGTYRLSLHVSRDKKRGSLLGSAPVRIEEFLPDRMRIKTSLFKDGADRVAPRGWYHPQQLQLQVELETLFGTAAAKRRVDAGLSLSPIFPVFEDYPGFIFADPLRAKNSFDEKLEVAETDEKGRARISLGLERFEKASYRLQVLTQGFEAGGGRFVSDSVSAMVSPLEYLLGYHPHGDLRFLRKGVAQEIELRAVDPDLQPIAIEDLQVRLLELKWVSVLTKQGNGTYAYQSVAKEIEKSSQPLSVPAAGMRYALATETPGRYALSIVDKEGTERSRISYTVTGAADMDSRLERDAELEVRLDKKEYAPGESIELSITAPYVGAGLITIEKDRVYAYKWFDSKTNSSVQKITVPASLEGNGYVHVSYVRALDSNEIFVSPLSYGIQPFSIERGPRRNDIELGVPDLVRPGEELRVSYSSRRRSKAVLMIVDEGILQVARHSTPDPLSYFFRKRALEVETMQMLDLILPEYSILRSLSAPGGGGDALSKQLNPFKRKREKPVVFWSGILEAGPKKRELSYHVPDYFNGRVRVMAVAVAESAVGSAEASTKVRGDFVFLPNVPSAVSPGDEFDVSVAVTNNVESSGADARPSVDLITQEGLEILSSPEKEVSIPEKKEKLLTYRLKAKGDLGSKELTFAASLGDVSSRLKYHVSVRPPSPLRTTIQAGASKGGTTRVDLQRRATFSFGREHSGSVSPLPLGFAQGLIGFLDHYPYGCTEQLISRALPGLFFESAPALSHVSRKKRERYFQVAMNTISARQNNDGSVSTWYPGGYASDEINTYVGLYLLEAKERGYPVALGTYNDVFRHLRTIANRTPESFADARTSAFAAYLLTRSGVVTSSYLTSLRGWFDQYESRRRITSPGMETWKKDIAGGFIAASYDLLRQRDAGEKLFKHLSFIEAVVPDYRYFHDSFTHGSLYLYLASRHFPEHIKGIAPDTLLTYLEPVSRNAYSTLSSSYALLALDGYVRSIGTRTLESIEVAEVDAKGAEREPVLERKAMQATFSIAEETRAIALKSAGYLFYQFYQQGYDSTPVSTAEKEGLEVYRQFLNAKGEEVKEIRLGEKLTVVLRARALDDENVPNVVLVDMLPGGFEVEMKADRFSSGRDGTWGFADASSSYKPEYADVREDRVLLFGEIPRSKTVEFRYTLTPTNTGQFVVPPVYGESMYDASITAVYPGDTIKVLPAEGS